MISASPPASGLPNVRNMKALHLIILTTYLTIIVNGRLIEKSTEKPSKPPPTESPTPVRVSRQAYYEDFAGISKEDSTQEDLHPYVRRGRYSVKVKKSSEAKVTNSSKDSKEITLTKKPAEVQEAQTKASRTLIKKPIPKFNEVDYEDFQGKINKSPVKYADSGEHEDEDFNLDDYEFDVNHDEFVGRGKPLEPRLKLKESKGTKSNKIRKPKTVLTPPEIKIQSKVLIPTAVTSSSSSKSTIVKKAANKMKEDYYDDVITTTKAPETETKRDVDDDFSDDNDESKEFNHKNNARVARSPWLVKYLGERMGRKTADAISNIVNFLPLFPDAPEYDNLNGVNFAEAMADPMTGQRWSF